MSADRGTAALVAALAMCLVTHRAAAQTDVAPPPTPPPVVVIAPSPQPQTVYVQQQAPQYGQAVYTQPGMDGSAPTERRGGRANLGPIIGGAAMLGVGWISNIVASLLAGVSFGFGATSGSGSPELWTTFRFTGLVPIAGPWIQLGIQPTRFDDDGWGPWLIIDGLLQAVGLTLLIVGIATSGGDDDESAEADQGIELAVVPTLGGLTLMGRF